MRWRGRRQSDNIEDRRASGGGGGRRLAVGGGLGVIVIVILAALFGKDPTPLLDAMNGMQGGGGSVNAGAPFEETAEEAARREFVSVVLADTEDVWNRLLRGTQTPYQEPNLVLFRDSVSSACGMQSSAVGPFYCPGDDRIYLDMSFFDELSRRLGAKGDFAQAYVIAHEVGHHIQNLMGISRQVQSQRARSSEAEGNELSVRLELQADFLAGVWVHHAQKMHDILENGDIEEAMNAAKQIGDDTLQRNATGRVRPESFTHGTSEQRMRWFRKGMETGDLSQGDTFEVPASRL